MDAETNPVANAALACGVGVAVLMMVSMCLGFVPFVGPLFNLFLYPLMWIIAIAGVVTGFVGFRHASTLSTEAGKAQAIIGGALSAMWMAFQAFILCLTGGVVGVAVLMSVFENM